MSRHLTSSAYPSAVIIQYKRDRDESNTQKAQQATRPPDPKPTIHRIRKERENRPERAPHQIIPCIHRGDVSGADLGAKSTLLVELRLDVLVVVIEEGDHREERSDENSDESETFRSEREMVNVEERYRKTLEPEVQQAIDQRQIEVDEEADRLGEGERERPDEYHFPNLFARHSLHLELWLALQLRIVRQPPDPNCPSIENVTAARLWQKEE
ncbi:hypothetical protein MMC26_006106 [Xylographa opegraphella]|nr:hypothetical protein [Xylographa opegraphella]